MPTRIPVRSGLFVDESSPRLIGSKCTSCGAHHFPSHDTCPYCATDGPVAVELSGAGRLWSWTAVTAPPPGYLGDVPYGMGIVELTEGIRVIGRLTEADPGRLQLGQDMHLEVVVLHTDDQGADVVTYAFAPDLANGGAR